MRLLVTRPEPDASAQARKLRQMGFGTLVEPLMSIEHFEPAGLDKTLSAAQALIVTSRNGLRALGRLPAIERARGLPMLAVGPATAQLARDLGFEEVHESAGGARGLIVPTRENFDPAKGPLVHLAGENLAFDLKGALEAQGFGVDQPVLYRTAARPELSRAARREFEGGRLGGVILMSPRTAKIYAHLIAAAALERAAAQIMHFCLSPNIAEQVSIPPDARTLVARRPREDDLLALIAEHAADCKGAVRNRAR